MSYTCQIASMTQCVQPFMYTHTGAYMNTCSHVQLEPQSLESFSIEQLLQAQYEVVAQHLEVGWESGRGVVQGM